MKEVSEENITPIDVEEPDYNTISDDQNKKNQKDENNISNSIYQAVYTVRIPFAYLKSSCNLWSLSEPRIHKI